MKKALSLLLLLSGLQGAAQYFQQKVDYLIDVTLDEKARTLNGFERINYTNQSPDTLHFIWFHLWPNAYKNDRTAFSDQLLQNGNTDFYFSDDKARGYINRLDFKANGTTARTEDHPQYIDVVKVVLPQPLAPGAKTVITTPFHVKLPFNFSRGGYSGESIQATQWYPKPAVYDSKGWHPMPYLDQGEFYSEFGSYDVRVTVPQHYVVAATGELQEENEKAWLKERKKLPDSKNNTNPNKATKTLQYKQDRVHDFAWFASRNFIVSTDTCQLSPDKTIEVYSYYTPSEAPLWKNSLQQAKDAARFYSSEVGLYPYNVLSVVQGPQSFGGGMEYPTITIIAPLQDAEELDKTIAHEIGHNWFYGVLASNEREHPWMDEGVNTFYERKYAGGKYKSNDAFEEAMLQTRAFYKKDQPISSSSQSFDELNYGLIAYHKTAAWLQAIENKIGPGAFREMMQSYYREWQFRHPQPEDLRTHLRKALGSDTTLLSQLDGTGLLPGKRSGAIAIASPLLPSSLKQYLTLPLKNVVLISPSVGINQYDKFMLGGLITNYQLPPSALQFMVTPLYSFHAKKLNGLATVHFTKVNANNSRWHLGVGGMRFSKNEQRDTLDNKMFESFYRITPHLRYTFGQPAGSSKEKSLEFRSFLIGEKDFSKFVVRSTDGLVYADSMSSSTRYVNQLTYSFANHRTLYPYQYKLQWQGGKEFMRLNATANYFFNYVKGGGLGVRFFAAKFFAFNDASFNTFQYQPKLLGVTGEEDYTYSNYFYGRSASEAFEGTAVENGGLAARQIMIRDGGLKMRMDQFENVQGRSDDWVASLNFTSTLPNNLFPVKLPILLFFDLGTYAEPWKKGSEASRFLYTGGIQLSLFNNVLNVYAPLIYSSVFKDNLKTIPEQNTFTKRLTFSIDIQNINLHKVSGYNLY